MRLSRYERKIEQARQSIARYEQNKADIDFEISQLEKEIEHYEAQIKESQLQQNEEN